MSGLGSFCTKMSAVVQVLGYVLLIFKVAIPVIIVALGAIDLGKAVTSGKDDDIKKNTKSLGIRIAAGILIFLSPSIILWIFGLINGFNDASDELGFSTCKKCILTPYKCTEAQKQID